jgi:hypothetical protein
LGLRDVFIALNNLVESNIIDDYAIGGGYAVMYYDIPIATYDLDVLVVLSGDDDFHRLYEYFRQEGAKIEDVYIYIDDMPVQFLPNYISPLFNAAIEEANEVEFEGVRSKFVSIEYLIALLLTAFRPKDRIRIQGLLDRADRTTLKDIIERFGNDQYKLLERYKEILENSQ